MKIGFDAKRLFNNFTGLGNHSRTTIDILTEEFPEHEYWLYTPKVKESEVTLPYMNRKGCRIVKPDGLLKGSAWRTYGLAKDIKRDGIEVFHGLSNEMPVGLHRLGIGSVVTIHDVAFKTFPDMYHWLDRKIYDKKWRYACNHADRIICISESTKNDVLRYYNVPEDMVDVVYQPVNPFYYTPMEKEDTPPYMLYVGSINSRKNLLGIVKAMEMMPKDLQIPLVVVGDGGAYKLRVKRYIAEHNMEDLFVWPNMVFSTALQRLYTNAQLFIFPSFYEGFGLPVVEALLSGCPVVTSNVSSLPEAGGPWAQQADPNNPEDICHKMVKLLTDTKLRQQSIEGGRTYAMETFAPQRLASQLMEVYKRVKS